MALIGSGIVYVLTQVLGCGLGLIRRSFLQGISSSFQNVKLGYNSDQQRRTE